MTNEQRIEPMLNYFGVSLEEAKGRSRRREIVLCRHFCMAILYETTEMGLISVGKYFGGRDHTTVIHALDNVESFKTYFRYKHYYKVFASILSEIRGHVDQMPEVIDYDQLYLPQLCEK